MFSTWAHKYLDQGYSPVLLHENEKKPVHYDWADFQHELPSEDLVQKWCDQKPNGNLGIALGPASGIIALDYDLIGFPEIENVILSWIPDTPCSKFGKKGWTKFYRYNGIPTCKFRLMHKQQVEFLSGGAQTVIPPSIHPETGQPYIWTGEDLLDVKQADLPELTQAVLNEIKNLIAFHSKKVSKYDQESKGGRHDFLLGICFRLLNSSDNVNEIAKYLLEIDEKNHGPKTWFSDPDDQKLKHPMDAAKAFVISAQKTVSRKQEFRGEVKSEAFDKKCLQGLYPDMRVDKDGVPTVPLCTLENVKALMDKLGAVYRNNVIKKDIEIFLPGYNYLKATARNDVINQLISYATYAKIPTQNIPAFAKTIASQNLYNPVMTWIESKPWDGTSRLQAFFDTVQVDASMSVSLKEKFIKKWLLSAVAAASTPTGIAAQGVLVFQGPQNLGKTTWFKSLVPAEIDVIKEGHTLRPEDKDSVYQAISNWLVELGELDATFKKSDIAQLKSFLTRSEDVIRLPYDREKSVYPRQTVFFGSVNEAEFLSDTTGNRRYWTIGCVGLNAFHGIDMQQLWAEVYALYLGGETYLISQEENETTTKNNQDFEVISPIEDLIATQYDWDSLSRDWKLAIEVLDQLGFERPTLIEKRHASAALQKLNGGKTRLSRGRREYSTPPYKSPN